MRHARFLLVIGLALCLESMAPPAADREEKLLSGCVGFLDEAGKALPVPHTQLSSLYQIDFSGLAAHPTLLERDLDRQAIEIARFLRDLYREIPVSAAEWLPIRSVAVVPWRWGGPWRQLDMFGETLTIRVGSRVLTADDLRSLWNRGVQYPWRSPERRFWRFTNPTGAFMTGIRRALRLTRRAAADSLKRLEERARAAGAAAPTDSPDSPVALLSQEALRLAEAWVGAEDPRLATLRRELAEQKPEQVADCLRRWREEIESEPAANAWLSTVKASTDTPPPVSEETSRRPTINVRVWFSLVGYGNLHWIRVTVGYGERAQSTAIASAPPARDFNLSVIGAVIGGYTVDVVDVRPFFDRLYLAETLGRILTP